MPDPLNLNTMPQQTWQRVSDLFDEVIELAEGDRIAFIRRLWGAEPEVASELAALLVAAAKVEKTTAFAQAPFDAVLNDALAIKNAAYRAGQNSVHGRSKNASVQAVWVRSGAPRGATGCTRQPQR